MLSLLLAPALLAAPAHEPAPRPAAAVELHFGHGRLADVDGDGDLDLIVEPPFPFLAPYVVPNAGRAGLALTLPAPGSRRGGDTATLVSGVTGLGGAAPRNRLRHPSDTLATGLVGHWPFDEGVGTIAFDASPYANDGTLDGPSWAPGRVGSALQFDGDDFVEVLDSSELRITGDISIAAWLYKDEPNNALRWDSIVAKAASFSWDYEFLTSAANSDELALYADTTSPVEVYAGQPVATSTWRHVAVTRAGSTVTFYIDGDPVATEPMAGAFAATSKPLLIGWDFLEGTIGRLDDVRLYERALSPTELRYLVDSAPPLGGGPGGPGGPGGAPAGR